MTIVCAYRPEGSDVVWMASDSLTVGGDFAFPERSRKVQRVGGWLIGSSGSDRIHEIVAALGVGDGRRVVDGDSPWDVRDCIMGAIRVGGWEPERQDRGGNPPAFGFSAILARRGGLWGVAGEGSVWEPRWGFVAIGSGQAYAYGAALALVGDAQPGYLVRRACEVAIEFRTDCGGEVVVETVR